MEELSKLFRSTFHLTDDAALIGFKHFAKRGAIIGGIGGIGGAGGYGAYRYRKRSSGRNGLQPRSSGAAANMQNQNIGSMY